MKTTDRIYSRLTPGAAANVAWALMPTDPHEAERVVATVPRELRAVPVLAFGYALASLQAISATWGVVHWRLMTARSDARAALMLAETDAALMAAAESVRVCEGQLLACDHALDAAAAAGGFDAQTVRDAALAERFEPMHPGAVCDPETAAALREVFRPLAA